MRTNTYSNKNSSITILILMSVILSACGPGSMLGPTLTPTPSDTPTPTNTPTPTYTPTNTATFTPTYTPTITNTPEPTFTPTSTPIPTPAVEMTVYESANYPFSIEYPSEWGKIPAWEGVTVAFGDSTGGSVISIAEEDLKDVGMGFLTLDEYVELAIQVMESELQLDPSVEYELLSREEMVNTQGFPVVIVTFLATFEGGFDGIITRLVYLHEGHIGFNATYVAPNTKYFNNLAAYSFNTFKVEKTE